MVRILNPEKLLLVEPLPYVVPVSTHVPLILPVEPGEHAHALVEGEVDPCEVCREQVRVHHRAKGGTW